MTQMQETAEAQKAAVGRAGAALVEDGMCIGLGTGSTAACAIAEIGRRVRTEGLRVSGVPTSFAAALLAREHGVPLVPLDDVEVLDLVLDGADEVDPALDLIKGRGGAHVRERIVAALGRRFCVLADDSKLVRRLGTRMPVPVEVLPVAQGPVTRALSRLGARPELRMAHRKDGPVVTDQGFWILDAWFDGGIEDPPEIARRIRAIPGVLDHGLFLGMATDLLVGSPGGEISHLAREAGAGNR